MDLHLKAKLDKFLNKKKGNDMKLDLDDIQSGLGGKHRDVCLAWLEGAKIETKLAGTWYQLATQRWIENEEYRVYDPEQWRKDYTAEQEAGKDFTYKGHVGNWMFCDNKEDYVRVEKPEVKETEVKPEVGTNNIQLRVPEGQGIVITYEDGTQLRVHEGQGITITYEDGTQLRCCRNT